MCSDSAAIVTTKLASPKYQKQGRKHKVSRYMQAKVAKIQKESKEAHQPQKPWQKNIAGLVSE